MEKGLGVKLPPPCIWRV